MAIPDRLRSFNMQYVNMHLRVESLLRKLLFSKTHLWGETFKIDIVYIIQQDLFTIKTEQTVNH